MLPERVAHARNLCAQWAKLGHTPTLGVCVARRGVIVLHEAFGVLGLGPDSPPLAREARRHPRQEPIGNAHGR